MQLGVASAMSLRTDYAINESKLAVKTMMTTDPQTFIKELLVANEMHPWALLDAERAVGLSDAFVAPADRTAAMAAGAPP
eukprot:508277-Amphidinium_carterae.1